jgi:hypothetical protein
VSEFFPDRKDALAENIRGFLRAHDVEGWWLVSEVWAVRADDTERIESGEIQPRDHPAREEALHIAGRSYSHRYTRIIWIKRPEYGDDPPTLVEDKPVLEEWGELPEGQPTPRFHIRPRPLEGADADTEGV